MLGAMHGTYETVDDRPALIFERRLAHPVERVWRAVTEPAELAHWFPSAVSGELTPGGTLTFEFPGGDMPTIEGEVIEVDPPRSLAFTWGDDVLRIELERDDDGCVLRFTVLFDDSELARRATPRAGTSAWSCSSGTSAGSRPTRPTASPRPTGASSTRSTSAAGCRPGRPSRRLTAGRRAVRGWGMADIDLAAVERELRARRDELEERLAGLARPPERGSQVGFGKRIGDGTTEAVSRLTDVGVGGSLELSEARVARALAKLAEGSYGICDGCGEPIAPARLAAAPESVLCIECARRAR